MKYTKRSFGWLRNLRFQSKIVIVLLVLMLIPSTNALLDDFFNDLKWDHMPLTYFFANEDECGGYEIRKIEKGFAAIENASEGKVYFEKSNKPADIDVTCSFLEGCYKKWTDIREEEGVVYRYETICAHTKGFAQIRESYNGIIKKATIEMIGLAGFAETNYGSGASGFYIGSCGHTTTEVHEILHTLGYGHSPSPDSIMYYSEEIVGYTIQSEGGCTGKRKNIDREIAWHLIKTYEPEIEVLPSIPEEIIEYVVEEPVEEEVVELSLIDRILNWIKSIFA